MAVARPVIRASLCRPNARHRGTPRSWTPPYRRTLHTEPVTDEVISELAARPLHPLTLEDLVKYGRPPLSAHELYNSANFTLSILPSRLAHRIQSLRSLPFIVVANPQISKIHSNYMHSLSTLLPWSTKHISTLQEEIEFTEVMANLVETHNNTISILARGFLEARKYIGKAEVTRFLDEHLRARIGTRLVAEQHIALHFSGKPHFDRQKDEKDKGRRHQPPQEPDPSFIGVIDTQLCPAQIVRHCEQAVGDICEFKYGMRPSIDINGVPDYEFAHIPMHMEYMLTELLKNSFRATIENGNERYPIEVTIAPLPEDPESTQQRESYLSHLEQADLDLASTGAPESHLEEIAAAEHIRPLRKTTPGVTIRIRDRGGGISPQNMKQIWNYSFTTFSEDKIQATLHGGSESEGPYGTSDALNAITTGAGGGSSLAGLGYGLPLGRAYAEYFGGGISVQSMYGWGTDVYLSLRGVGKID